MAGAEAAFDHNQIMVNSQAHSRMQGMGGGGGGNIAPGNIGMQHDNAIEHINAVANTGTIAFANLLKGLDQASPLKDMQFGLSKPLPSPVPGLAGGKSHGIMGAARG